MTRILKLCLLPLVVSALAACGPASPVFPEKLDGGNSLKVTVRVDSDGPVGLGLHAGYVANSKSCHYTPRAFGVIAQTRPVHSTAYVSVPVRQVSPTEFAASVPLPAPNKCDWAVRKLVPDVFVSGKKVNVFDPDMSVTGSTYLPEGQLTYYCAPFQSKYREDTFLACDLKERADATTTIHISVRKPE